MIFIKRQWRGLLWAAAVCYAAGCASENNPDGGNNGGGGNAGAPVPSVLFAGSPTGDNGYNANTGGDNMNAPAPCVASGDSLAYDGKKYKTNETEETKLYNILMQYREEKGLPRIPISKSLTYVAQIHVIDLHESYSEFDASCNLHSWSDKGDWAACCYTDDHANAQGMWNKPRELTSYTGNGYENSYYCWGTGGCRNVADQALNMWKNSSGHNNTIINEDIWKNYTWNAIGIGIYTGPTTSYAVTWFGREPDDCVDNGTTSVLTTGTRR